MNFVSRILYPLFLLTTLTLAWFGHQYQLDVRLLAGGILVGSGLILMILEFVMPYTERWRPDAALVRRDLLHSLLSSFAMAVLMRATLLAMLAYYGASFAQAYGVGLWPVHWHIGLQFALAVLIADLGAYTAHRLMHLTRIGWLIHATHHSPTRMHFLAAGRTHPFNAIWTLTLEHGSILFLGISPEAMLLFTVYKGVNGLLQHSNVDLRPGWLSYLLATNEVHWWHHSSVLAESETNFGNTTMVWDHVFRSFRLPKDERPRADVGIDNATIPEDFLVHLGLPFRLAKYEQSSPVSQAK